MIMQVFKHTSKNVPIFHHKTTFISVLLARIL